MASRWDELAADLAGRAAAEQHAARAEHAAEITRAGIAETSFLDRVRAGAGAPVTFELRGLGHLHGVLVAVGRDAFRVHELSVDGVVLRELLVPSLSVLSASGLGSRVIDEQAVPPTAARLGLGHWLRGLARDRLPVEVLLVDGSARRGTLDVVGVDYLELAEHAADLPRRRTAVSGHRLLPFAAVAAVAGPAGPLG